MTSAILTCRLGDAASRVREAAARAAMDVVPWNGQRNFEAGKAPAFVVAGLGRGERRIPPDVIDVVTRVVPGAPLLLVCEEELSSRTPLLHRGRVTLLGPPFTAARLYSEMRTLLARTSARTLTRELGTNGGWTRERAGERYWLAHLSATDREHLVTVAHEDDVGLTVVVALVPDGEVHRKDAERGAIILRASADDATRTEQLRATFGARTGLVHVDDDAATWLVYWPSSHAPLVVHSSVRLPNAFHAPRADAGSSASLVRLPTCEGDVLVALSAPLAESSLGDLARHLASGGPTAVDAVAHCKSAAGGLPAGVVVEVWP